MSPKTMLRPETLSRQESPDELERVAADLRETNTQLEQASCRFQSLFQGLPVACFSYDAQGRIYEWNRACEELYGLRADEVVEKNLVETVFLPRDAARVRNIVARVFAGESLAGLEWKNKRRDGTTFPALQNTFPLRDRCNNIVGAISASFDMTQTKRAEQAVRKARASLEARVQRRTAALAEINRTLQEEVTERKRAEAELERVLSQSEQLFASITSLLISVDENNCIITWNATASRTFGITLSDALDKPFRECGVQWQWERILPAVARCQETQQTVRVEDVRYLNATGQEGFLGVSVNPIHGDLGKSMGFLLLAAEITERKFLEGQLAQSQKLESIGQLAAGIAHEINTPIQYVGDNTRFFQESFGDLQTLLAAYSALGDAVKQGCCAPEQVAAVEAAAAQADLDYLLTEVPSAIQQSLEGVERVAHIVQAMKDFSHPGTAEKTPIDLNRAVDSTVTVARNEWKYVAALETDFDPDLPLVPCLPGELNQVLLNMIINAAHAIGDVVGDGSGDKGVITVRTGHDQHWATIRISDTGTGIRDEIRARIFDPFFTTKPVGRGTGQGLAISHAIIVEKHGGMIVCESEVGRGTAFTIRLPLENASDAAETAA